MKFVGAAVVGFLLGLMYCYWKAIKSAYENKDLISSGSNLIDAGQDFYGQLTKKL